MDKHLAQRIIQDIKTSSLRRLESSSIFLQPLGAGYTAIPLSRERFTPIKTEVTQKQLIFLDGGNAEIVKTPDYSLQFLRFAAVGFVGKKKVFHVRKEGYVLVQSRTIDGKLCFVTECYGGLIGSERLIMAVDDPQLSISDDAPIATVANIYRALLEIQFGAEVISENSVLVFDRALKPETVMEEEAFASLYNRASTKNAMVCGLNKTTSLLCNTGESIVAALQHFDVEGKWLYSPVFSTFPRKHAVAFSFVKLHAASRYIFRFEVHQQWRVHVMDLASWLSYTSNDAVFLGYPYGLIAADRFARVTNRERDYLKTMFFSYAGEKGFALEALDAHGVLDRMG
jgi:hypothetical protein